MKKVILVILTTIFLGNISLCVFATTGAYGGIREYRFCGYGIRAGSDYVDYLSTELAANNGKPNKVNKSHYVTNSMVYPSRLSGFSSFDDLFVYAGHGIRFDYDTSLNNMATLHTYASSSTDTYHYQWNNYEDKYNLSWNEWAGGGSNKWGVFYSCNWLANGTYISVKDTCYNSLFTYTNMRLAMGYASRMYLDQREGRLLGQNIRNNMTLKSAFFNAAKKFQPQLSPSVSTYNGKVVARVAGNTKSENDKFDSYYTGSVNNYSTNPQDYNTWDSEIPCTGTEIPGSQIPF